MNDLDELCKRDTGTLKFLRREVEAGRIHVIRTGKAWDIRSRLVDLRTAGGEHLTMSDLLPL